jgi:hypothetical protein
VYEGCTSSPPFSVGTAVEIADAFGTTYSMVTNESGRAGFSAAAPGQYTITIPGRTFCGGAPATISVNVTTDTGTSFQLAP